MKGLTLTEPWATMVAVGAKCFETRSWNTPYRGPVAIHAAKGLGGFKTHPAEKVSAAELRSRFVYACSQPPFASVLAEHVLAPGDLPLGAIVAVCELTQTAPTEQVRGYLHGLEAAGAREIAFGDYSPGRFAFELTDVRQVEPLECTGALGFWDVPVGIGNVLAGRVEAGARV